MGVGGCVLCEAFVIPVSARGCRHLRITKFLTNDKGEDNGN